ncbi:DNA-binding MarR family transcriptional regulator [Vagococcus fluvialis]|uniref:MarR family transcriptional regulator n=2 Tax=Vagococcus fluvialis TaxID=2738 RepID=A0A369AX13_9ENTE|nr:MarR family transcriptional regulator [Vagococcus fluvialis]NKC59799.1 MarR family transcriptional regulator [Vagococcus fluvialis]NKC66869.1 MarR family transcriptional regulator [Vagococcus fluvialis]NKD50696.1 MarR family transcriptional regulator [Vagococcus fluvialis]RCX13683.1 DNA-binding MarR family transcriptional regulator [Vagococcus fluvialis]
MTEMNKWNQALVFGAITRVKLQHILDKLAETEDLTGQQMVVLLGLRNNGVSSVGKISDTFLLKQTNVSSLIKKMEQTGLLMRQRNGEDVRIVDLSLTKEGNEKVDRLIERIEASYQKLKDDNSVQFEFEELRKSFLDISQIIDYFYKQEF